jgi:hypothetical protein
MNISLAEEDDIEDGRGEGAAPTGSTPLEAAQAAKAAGLAAAKANDWPRAAASFRHAAGVLQAAYWHHPTNAGSSSTAAGGAEAHALRVDCLNNRAQVLVLAARWSDAEAATTEVLSIDPANLKARFRRCRARLQLPESSVAAAVDDLCVLRRAEPHNPQVQRAPFANKSCIRTPYAKQDLLVAFFLLVYRLAYVAGVWVSSRCWPSRQSWLPEAHSCHLRSKPRPPTQL